MIKKLRSFFEDVRDVALFVAGAPTALKTAGAFTRGIATTIASPKTASFVNKVGFGLTKSGSVLGNILKAGATSVYKSAVVPTAKAVGKSLPGSKIIQPVVKYIPSTAALYGIISGTTYAIKSAQAIAQAKDPVKVGIMSTSSMARTGKDFDPTKVSSYWNLLKRVLTFK